MLLKVALVCDVNEVWYRSLYTYEYNNVFSFIRTEIYKSRDKKKEERKTMLSEL